MNWDRVGLVVALGALAVSSLVRRSPPNVEPSPRGVAPSTVAPSPTAGARDSSCQAALARCESKAWSSVADAIREDVRARRDLSRAADAGERHSSVADQQRELCDVAREHLRKSWKDERAGILAGVRDVGSEAWVARELEKSLGGFAGYGLDPVASARLRDGYRALLARDGARIHEALEADPPALDEVLEDLRGFYGEEDQLVREVLGAAAVERHRDEQRRTRTTILAIAATLADEDWDEAIAW